MIKILFNILLLGFILSSLLSIVIKYPPKESILVSSPVLITNNNFNLENKIYILKDGADCPVLIIGNEENTSITNIKLSNIEIYGNRANQTKELYKITSRGLINNNGIFIQNATDIKLENIKIKDCKSGGLVTTLGVKNLYINNLTSENNEWDGIALYETKNSLFSNIYLKNNNAAGISLDNNFNNNVFSNIYIFNNGSAIFMRNSNSNLFNNVFLSKNKSGIFIAQQDSNINTACSYNKFYIKSDAADYIKINDKSCLNNEFY